MPSDVLAIVLALSLWIASGCLVLAITDGLGAHPARRVILGVLLVASCLAALAWRIRVCAMLRTRPWLVLPLAAAQLTVMALDGLVGEPFQAFSLTSVGLAAIVASVRTVWLCVAILDFGYLALALVQRTPAELAANGDLGVVLGVMIGNVAAAVPLILLRQRFGRLVDGASQLLADVREGSPAMTLALAYAITPERAKLPSGGPGFTLTERSVVEALSMGRAPKQIARDRGVTLATIRTHLMNAKRKSGARTLAELATIPARSDWPGARSDDT
ncbi:MAG: Bacterial regulatory protein luxR family [bacterium]